MTYVYNTSRGGATVLKVGGQILQAKRAANFFDPPHFLASGGTKYCLKLPNSYVCGVDISVKA